MFSMADAAKIWDSADIPQAFHILRAAQQRRNLIPHRQCFQCHQVIRFPCAGQPMVIRGGFERGNQARGIAKFQPRIAPLQLLYRRETVVGDGIDHAILDQRRFAGYTETAVAHIPPRATGDLGQFIRLQGAHPAAVEFGQRGKGNMVDIKVQPHADCVGRHQIIDITILVHFHLRVAGARGQGPHHHRRPALLSAQQFGDGIDVIHRKADNGAAPGHTADFLGAGIDQFAKAITAQELCLWHQFGNGPAHRIRAQKQGFLCTTGVQQAVGENMAAFGVGTELNFINRQKIGAHAIGHRLDRADPVLGARWHDAFLAGDQCHNGRAAQINNAVINLARQQA